MQTLTDIYFNYDITLSPLYYFLTKILLFLFDS
jgi:hypothetical protein